MKYKTKYNLEDIVYFECSGSKYCGKITQIQIIHNKWNPSSICYEIFTGIFDVEAGESFIIDEEKIIRKLDKKLFEQEYYKYLNSVHRRDI